MSSSHERDRILTMRQERNTRLSGPPLDAVDGTRGGSQPRNTADAMVIATNFTAPRLSRGMHVNRVMAARQKWVDGREDYTAPCSRSREASPPLRSMGPLTPTYLSLLFDQRVGDVVLVDIGDVLH